MIESIAEFLAYAVALEAEAVAGYDALSERMQSSGNAEVAALFTKLGGYSRLHLAETSELYRQHVGREPGPSAALRWPDGTSPESPGEPGADCPRDVRAALQFALTLERRACDFYSLVANQSRDAGVQELAQGFADEESEHVSHLERWLRKLDAS